MLSLEGFLHCRQLRDLLCECLDVGEQRLGSSQALRGCGHRVVAVGTVMLVTVAAAQLLREAF
jgi:hypothetical protein